MRIDTIVEITFKVLMERDGINLLQPPNSKMNACILNATIAVTIILDDILTTTVNLLGIIIVI